jgi:hypothetical protein
MRNDGDAATRKRCYKFRTWFEFTRIPNIVGSDTMPRLIPGKVLTFRIRVFGVLN